LDRWSDVRQLRNFHHCQAPAVQRRALEYADGTGDYAPSPILHALAKTVAASLACRRSSRSCSWILSGRLNFSAMMPSQFRDDRRHLTAPNIRPGKVVLRKCASLEQYPWFFDIVSCQTDDPNV
jgi:hypothetical protein